MSPKRLQLPAFWRGVRAGLLAVLLLLIAAFPSRLSLAVRGWGLWSTRAVRALGGTLLDLSAVLPFALPMVALVAVLVPLILSRARRPGWQQFGAVLAAAPWALGLWVMTVLAQEVKSERGSFPMVFDLMEGSSSDSMLVSLLGYATYARIWQPALAGLSLGAVVLVPGWRRRGAELLAWRDWSLGLVAALALGGGAAWGLPQVLGRVENAFSPAALGDPLTGLIESVFDLAQHKGPATPRDLVLDAQLGPEALAVGEGRLGWPARHQGPHPHARPLDFRQEPFAADARGRQLLEALADVSKALLPDGDPNVALFHLSLEGYRADDLHALNPEAPVEVAPFTNSLYEGKAPGVLAASHMFQAGVRTAHGLGAMTCGLGTLPYNLAFIRDLQPFPVRCAMDVLRDAGFAHAFFYGSDGHFDEMDRYFKDHGYAEFVSQAELPKDLPKGTWDAVTDFAVFDRAVQAAAAGVKAGPRFTMLMSLSNHSPFTAPQDQPKEIAQRVDAALAKAANRADADDRLRLLTYSYTDAAVERLFRQLDEQGLAERSIVMLMADHSTGHAYVWGKVDLERDEAKSQVPFAIVIPEAFLQRAKDRPAAEAALARARALIEAGPLSLNDVPAMWLALLSAHPGVQALPADQQWHSMGGQVTSPYFNAGGEPRASLLGINGVSELYALDAQGKRIGGYEDSVFLKTRADRYRVTPRLIPVTAALIDTMRLAPEAPPSSPHH